ncbi:MAG: hypothetical protein HND59_08300 [Pseudomonadota bacterium]|nr:MAG: hypothetical protein HND59_08300 [Pseudomonadota bacterium]
MSARPLSLLLAGLLITACAATPKLDTQGIDKSLSPDLATETLDLSSGRRVHWGGVIVSSRNQADESVVELLAYPLGDSGRPNTDSAPLGRILAVKKGYLETLDYSAGKIASFVGTVQPSRSGRVGATEYRYPVLQIEQSALWPPSDYGKPQFRIGIGIGISR